MDAGVHLPQMALRSASVDAGRVREVARTARDLGYAAVAANDHFAFTRPWLDGPTLLAAVAADAAPLDLATTVALPGVRGPAQLGAALAALEVLAPGRVVAGVGPGSSPIDHALAGLDFDDRWAGFDEAVAVLRALLRGDPLPPAWAERLGDAVAAASVAVGAGRAVPIWVASWGSPAGLRRVARLGDGWLASAYNTSPAEFRAGRATLADAVGRIHGAERGSEREIPAALATMWTWVTDDEAEADGVLDDLAQTLRRDPAALRDRLCIGPPERCARLLSEYAAAGCRRVYHWPVGDEVDQLERLARDVLPLVEG